MPYTNYQDLREVTIGKGSGLSFNKTDCRRCLSADHEWKDCDQPCSNCGRVRSWCSSTKCTAVCSECEGNHLVRQCPEISRDCKRCGSSEHKLSKCTEPCANCGRVESWCTKERCTALCSICDGNHLAKQCPDRKCSRCGDLEHMIKQCKQACSNCHRVESWCTPERCTAKCSRCEGNHLSRQCPDQVCDRCGSSEHLLRECTVPCETCKRVESWCTKDSCRLKCPRCEKPHYLKDCKEPCQWCCKTDARCTKTSCIWKPKDQPVHTYAKKQRSKKSDKTGDIFP